MTTPAATPASATTGDTTTGDATAERILAAVASPATDDAFDPGAALDGLLGCVGMSGADAGGRVAFVGADPVVPSALRLGGGAAVALAAKSVGMAAVHRDRGGDGQDVTVDVRRAPHRLCPFYDRRWELVNGYPAASPAITSQALGFSFHRTRDDRWVMPLNPYPALRARAETFLGAPESGVAEAIARWDAAELEEAASDVGIVMPMARTPANGSRPSSTRRWPAPRRSPCAASATRRPNRSRSAAAPTSRWTGCARSGWATSSRAPGPGGRWPCTARTC